MLEGEKEGDTYTFYGYVVSNFPRYGYFSLSDLEEAVGPWGLKIERDMHFKPCKLGDVVEQVVY